MAIDWGLFQAPNVAGNALQGLRAGRNDMMEGMDFQARQEDRQYRREQDALETKRAIATEDEATRQRHRAAAARLYAGLLGVPEAQRRAVAAREAANMGLSPEELARVTGVINDPATTWDDASVRSRVVFLGGEVPSDTYQNVSGVGLVRVPGQGGNPTVAVAAQPDPTDRYIRGQDNNLYDTQTGQWITGPAARARPSTARSGGGRGGGGRGGGSSGVPSGFVLD